LLLLALLAVPFLLWVVIKGVARDLITFTVKTAEKAKTKDEEEQ